MVDTQTTTSNATPSAKKAPARRKAAARKAAPKKPKSAPRLHVDEDKKVRVLADENPYRPGTKRFKRFAAYRTGTTVGALLKSKSVNRRGLRRDISEKLISLT